MIVHNYLTVVGRASGDDEDTAEQYEHMTVEQARNAFIDFIQENDVDEDVDVFINFVLVSQSPIEIYV